MRACVDVKTVETDPPVFRIRFQIPNPVELLELGILLRLRGVFPEYAPPKYLPTGEDEQHAGSILRPAPSPRVARAPKCDQEYNMASVERYPRATLSTPGTSGYYISYNRVLRAVLQTPLRWGIF